MNQSEQMKILAFPHWRISLSDCSNSVDCQILGKGNIYRVWSLDNSVSTRSFPVTTTKSESTLNHDERRQCSMLSLLPVQQLIPLIHRTYETPPSKSWLTASVLSITIVGPSKRFPCLADHSIPYRCTCGRGAPVSQVGGWGLAICECGDTR
jgi:hypothetical protein